MRNGSSKVHVIVAPDYGERLAGLPPNEPVWVADTTVNKPVIERLRAQKRLGVTSFRVDLEASTEDWLISILDEVELHHGEFSQSKPYAELSVTGTDLSAELRRELESHGFKQFKDVPDGFLANKMAA